MPKQETFFDQQSGNRKIEVLKSYDQGYAHEAFRNMDEAAQSTLWNVLNPEEIYDRGGEGEDVLWDELLESAREDGSLLSFSL